VRLELHATAGEQRCVAEDSAGVDGVEDRAVGTGVERHLTVFDHPHLVGNAAGVVGHPRPRRELLDRGTVREPVEFVLRHRLERDVLGQEAAQVHDRSA
jgi:hypothetical protein